MKLLLLGANGQVGWELQRSLAPLGEVVCVDRRSTGGDLAQPETLAKVVRTLRPDVIVNAAGYTAVDKAESEPELARLINSAAPAELAREAATSGAWLVHYSTDYVFDGSGDAPRREDAPTAPLNVYGRTKLEGEQLIASSGCSCLILRTSWVYAARGNNFARTMLRLAGERDRLTVVDDQIGAPTGADLLADVTAHMLRTAMFRPEVAGVYHVVAAGETSWHGYARFLIERAREHGRVIRVSPESIAPVPSSAFPTPARRPLNSRLDTGKLRAAFGLALPPWQAGVERLLAEWLG
jgi:dTDP-4-dehydrorhamnose reductase